MPNDWDRDLCPSLGLHRLACTFGSMGVLRMGVGGVVMVVIMSVPVIMGVVMSVVMVVVMSTRFKPAHPRAEGIAERTIRHV